MNTERGTKDTAVAFDGGSFSAPSPLPKKRLAPLQKAGRPTTATHPRAMGGPSEMRYVVEDDGWITYEMPWWEYALRRLTRRLPR